MTRRDRLFKRTVHVPVEFYTTMEQGDQMEYWPVLDAMTRLVNNCPAKELRFETVQDREVWEAVNVGWHFERDHQVAIGYQETHTANVTGYVNAICDAVGNPGTPCSCTKKRHDKMTIDLGTVDFISSTPPTSMQCVDCNMEFGDEQIERVGEWEWL